MLSNAEFCGTLTVDSLDITAQSCWGCRFAVDVVEKMKFHTLLDAGTGSGALVSYLFAFVVSRLSSSPGKVVADKVSPSLLISLPTAGRRNTR